ncbi:MAG: carbohydrate porin [Candidatus Eisenbacteria bacterium]|nr:carbohydrate porin [Candidatus Eisenbacteria bacterium]
MGDALTVSNLDGFDSIRLYQAWAQQEFLEGRLSLRAGSLAADEEFTGTEGGGLFSNGAFGWSAGVGANIVNGGPIYFSPALGARIGFAPSENWSFRAGLYDGDSFDSPAGDPTVNQHGLHFSLGTDQGTFAVAEAGHSWTAAGEGGALPGTFRLGVWRHSADFSDNWADANGESFTLRETEPAMHHGNRGWYSSFEQRLWAEKGSAEQGVSAWLRVSGAPSDRSAVEWASDGGFQWAGPLPGRDDDVFGIAVATAHVSRGVQAQVRDELALSGEGGVVPDFERVVEGVYQIRIAEHWNVSPGLQWVQHPGMSSEIRNAWVPSLRVTFE